MNHIIYEIHDRYKANVHLFILLLFYVQGEVVPFKSYLQRYATPYVACQSSDPLWYAVRRASAHIIVLSSYSPYGKRLLEISSKHMYLSSILRMLQ